jgi:O-acetyl-ADP-ribose deacetylase (regulator of RNase III)
MRIELVQGDITRQVVDAVVNAANSSLLGGGGVDGMIHDKGGDAILAECRELRRTRFPDGLPTGQSVATSAGRLPATWVIHTVGPIYHELRDQGHLLRSCYTTALEVADQIGAASVAFPLISSGIFGWPVDDAVRQALAGIRAADSGVTEVRLVLYGQSTYDTAVELFTSA